MLFFYVLFCPFSPDIRFNYICCSSPLLSDKRRGFANNNAVSLIKGRIASIMVTATDAKLPLIN